MKKLITIILVLALLLPAAALAVLPDISGLSTEELLELNHMIQMQLFSEQLVNGVTVPHGTYIIGQDIPAGDYRVVVTSTLSFSTGSLIEGESDWKEVAGIVVEGGQTVEIGKLTLEEGLNLYLNYVTAVFYPYTGLFH